MTTGGTETGYIRNYIGNCTSSVFQEKLIASSIVLLERIVRLQDVLYFFEILRRIRDRFFFIKKFAQMSFFHI